MNEDTLKEVSDMLGLDDVIVSGLLWTDAPFNAPDVSTVHGE